MGWHDGPWAHKVTHATYSVHHQPNPCERSKIVTSRRQLTGGTIEWKLFNSKKERTYVQDGITTHTSKDNS